jgi:hypothetical protein
MKPPRWVSKPFYFNRELKFKLCTHLNHNSSIEVMILNPKGLDRIQKESSTLLCLKEYKLRVVVESKKRNLNTEVRDIIVPEVI